jgi:chemosensory pili system protein ChpA (sensor histidine kinase/response regulator)
MSERMDWSGAPSAANTLQDPPVQGGGPRLPDLLSGFLAEVRSYLPKVQRALTEYHLQPQQAELLQEAQRHVRTLKGAAAVVGLTSLSDIAISLEEVLEKFALGGSPLTEVQLLPLKQLLEQLDVYLEQVARGDQAIPHGLTQALRAVRQLLHDPVAHPAKSFIPCLPSQSRAAAEPDLSAWLDLNLDLNDDLSTSPAVLSSPPPTASPDRESNIPAELLEVFLPEAEEHLRVMTVSLPLLAAQPHNKALLQEIRRSAHSLKGSAAVVGFQEITRLAHRMEDLLDLLYEDELQLLPAHVQLLFASTEVLENLLNQQPDHTLLPQLYQAYAELLSVEPAQAVRFTADASAELADPAPTARATNPLPSAAPVETDAEAEPAAIPSLKRGQEVRVPIERLDVVVKLVTELLVNQAGFEQHMKRLQRQLEELRANSFRLNRVASKMEVQFEASTLGGQPPLLAVTSAGARVPGSNGSPQGPAPVTAPPLLNENTYGFDALEFDRYTEFHLLLRELTESANDVQTLEREVGEVKESFDSSLNRQARLCSEIQEHLMRLRMVPLSTLASRLHRTAHTVAAQRDKLVNFAIEGEETRLDKTVVEEMADPLLHLLRNAIDHGIEPPATRAALGKPAHGSVRLRAFHEGTQTVIQIGDDGAGLNPERLRQSALQHGLLTSAAAAQASEQELYSLIFLPGFSTATEVSEISGRGVGMDIVKATVHRLKGSIQVDSQPGAGTILTIRLLTTLAVMRALLVKTGQQTFAIPVIGLSQVIKLTPDVLDWLGQDRIVRTGGHVYPLLQLNQLLNLPAEAISTGTQLALLLTVEDRPVAIAVDETLGGREIVVKNLGNHLRRVHGVTGATLLGDGRVVLILNLPELVREVFRPRAPVFDSWHLPRPADRVETWPAAQFRTGAKPPDAPLTVMIVDDSLSVRRVLTNRLTAAGWHPLPAKDGLDALEQLQHLSAPPDLFLVDIEMPRMDGYEFMSTLRKQPGYADVPVIVLTSRAGQKHRARAFEAGATEYLIKPYQDDMLLSLIRRLTQSQF